MRRLKGIGVPEWCALTLLAAIPFLLSWHTLTSIYQDIGRHLTIGERIWKTGSVPRTNLFSYTVPDFPFINHHWLGEVLLYLGERAVGLRGLIAVKAVLAASAFTLAFAAAWRRTILIPSLAVGLIAVLVMAERTDVRPEMLSFLFIGWFLLVLYRKPDSNIIWTLPFVQMIWVNTHIYFFMGPFIYVSWLVGLMVRDGRNVFTRRRPWLLGAAIAGATLMNPWFLQGALYPLNVFDNYGYSIVENKTFFFLRAFGYPGFTFGAMMLGLFVYVVSLVLNRSRLRENIMGILLMAGVTILGLMMIRNLPLFGLVMLPATLQNLSQAPVRWPMRGTVVASVMLLLFGVSIARGQWFARLGAGSRSFGLTVPAGHQQAVDYFKSAGFKGPIFNNFDIGSYLIWRLPEEQVFIDGRPEAYPAAFIQETYIAAQEQAAVWERVVEQYGLNAVIWNVHDITPWSRAFLARLSTTPGWYRVYDDGSIAIWLRDTPDNRKITGRPDGPMP